jgi:DNA-binding NarL/FixJ family response regulator
VDGYQATGIPPRLAAEPLTAGELRVLRLLVLGLNQREIAWELYLTQSALTAYTRRIAFKLGARSPAGVVARAHALGVLV